MEEFREIIDLAVFERALTLAAPAIFVLGLSGGLVWGARRRRLAAGVAMGALAGLVGPLVWGLWAFYGMLVGRLGLDSVKALLINLGVFVAVGVGAGLAWGAAWRRWGGVSD